MIYSSIGPNPAMVASLSSSGSSKNARNSTVRRMVISFGAPSVDAVVHARDASVVLARFG